MPERSSHSFFKERRSGMFFPSLFFLFNIAYWYRYYRVDEIREIGWTPAMLSS